MQKLEGYKQRMIKEYQELKDKYTKLHKMLIKNEAGTLEFTPTCNIGLLEDQAYHMGCYLKDLEIRAEIEGIGYDTLTAIQESNDNTPELIFGNRGEGKSAALIKKCNAERGSIIVCPNHEAVKHLLQEAGDMNLPIPVPITFAELLNDGLRNTGYTKIYVDELFGCLQTLGITVSGATVDTTNLKIETLIS